MELRSNFLGPAHSRHQRTAIGGSTGAGLRRELSGRQSEKFVPWIEAHFPKRLLGEVGGYGGGGGRSRECAVARSGAPPFSREPNKERTAQPTWAWSPASSPTPSPGFQAQSLRLLAGFLAYLRRPPNRPFLQHLRHKNSLFSTRSLL